MTMRKTFLPLVAGVAALIFAASAEAHGSMKPQHGGVVQMVGETLFELVARPDGVALYVKEDDEEVASSGMTAKLTVTTAAGAKMEAPLAPAGGNKFEAKGLKIPAGAKVAVMLVNKATQSRTAASFTLK